jgi:hypothetical protein
MMHIGLFSNGERRNQVANGFVPLMSWVPPPKQLKDMIEIYQRVGEETRRDAPRSRVRVSPLHEHTGRVCGTRAPFHLEAGKGTRPKLVKFQLRADPLAR